MLRKITGSVGEDVTIDTPVHANWGLRHVHFGKHIYCNAFVSFVDDGEIFIGDDCMIGPGTVFATAGHPGASQAAAAALRVQPAHPCGENVAASAGPSAPPAGRRSCCAGQSRCTSARTAGSGASVTVCPGVTIGDNCVIGAGAVVTRDIPANSFAAGVPCRVIREITDADSMNNFPQILADNQVMEE